MPKVIIDFTGATFTRPGSAFKQLPDGTKTNVRYFLRISLEDGTVYEYSPQTACWRKWIARTTKNWAAPQGFYRETSPQITAQLDQAWAEGFREAA